MVLPFGYYLNRNHSSQVEGNTAIVFGLPREEPVVLEVHNSAGQVVCSARRTYGAGDQVVHPDGLALGAATCYYTLKTGTFRDKRKMIVP